MARRVDSSVEDVGEALTTSLRETQTGSNSHERRKKWAMLEPWIIEQIRKREQEQQRRQERQPLVPIQDYPPPRDSSDEDRDDQDIPTGDRGVVIINL